MEEVTQSIAENLAKIHHKISTVCVANGQKTSDVTLVAISKTFGIERIKAAFEAGCTNFGENKVQEALTKMPHLPHVRWHMVGTLQSNKSALAAKSFNVIQSVDSIKLLRRLNQHAVRSLSTKLLSAKLLPSETLPAKSLSTKPLPANLLTDKPLPNKSFSTEYLPAEPLSVLAQINFDAEGQKSGLKNLDDLYAFTDFALSSSNLRLDGLMCIPPAEATEQQTRHSFASCRRAFENIKQRYSLDKHFSVVSMGMSNDYHWALAEGSTMIRIGRAIFGLRHSL